MKEMIALLQENNRILNEVNQKLSQLVGAGVAMPSQFGITKEMMLALGEQYSENSDIVVQENAVATMTGGNLFIHSKMGRLNVNLSEKEVKSSFIKSVAQRGTRIIVKFKSGKTYQYTSQNKTEFNRVADLLLTSPYVGRPFLENLRSNPAFNYQVV